MTDLPPISHQWTEEDRLRLIYRIAEVDIYLMRRDIPPSVKLENSKRSMLLITQLVGESVAYLENMRSEFDEYLDEEEK